MNVFIKFKEIDEDITHYGIYHKASNKIICFCCGGELDKDEVEILEEYPFSYLEETLKEFFE